MAIYYQVVAYVLAGVVGLCVGSFLNVVIYRMPLHMNLATPPSHCTTCEYQLQWYDNIPVVSYLILKGKCRSCGQHISFRYTVVEILNAVLWLLCVAVFWEQSHWLTLIAEIICSLLLVISCIDLEHMIIMDRFQIMLAVLTALAIVFFYREDWLNHVIGGGVALVLFLGTALVAYAITKREALGGGDVKLAVVFGFLLGWRNLILGVLIASIFASVVLLVLQKKNNEEKHKEYPFAPFLAFGFGVAFLFGDAITSGYVNLVTGLFL